jgi:hypothetical protein
MKTLPLYLFIATAIFGVTPPLISQQLHRTLDIAEQKTLIVTLNPKDIPTRTPDFIIWEPGRNLRTDIYETYYLERSSFEKILGNPSLFRRSTRVELLVKRMADKPPTVNARLQGPLSAPDPAEAAPSPLFVAIVLRRLR